MFKRTRNGAPPLPPGPRGLPLIGSLPYLGPNPHRYFSKLAQTYGPIMKLKLGSKLCIIITSPNLVKEVLRCHDAIFANRDVPAAIQALSYDGNDMAFSPYGPKWRMMRKVCSRELMHPTVLDFYYSLRRCQVHQMVCYVRTQVGTPVDIGKLGFQTALNMVTCMIWGGTLDGEDMIRVGHEIRHLTKEMNELLATPNVSDLFPIISRFDVQGIVGHMKRLWYRSDQIFESIIDQRLKMDRGEGGKESKDFLQLLLKLKEEGVDPKTPLNLTHIKAMFMDMMGGGTDTTSSIVEWAMAEMMQNPEIMRKAQEELEQVVGMDNMVEESHMSKLPYLEAVLKEVLRLHPPVPFLIPRSPSQTCTVGGYTVPKGTQMIINIWAIHRDPEAWDNPLEFCPERFYNSTSKWDYRGNDFRYIPFGSGRRMCVGISMAERMLTYVLASLLHSFDWRLPDDAKLNLSDKFRVFLKKETPLVVIPTPRLANPEFYY
ncbi:flavonoid 3'-monooxygenase CYP75B137-like [Magnolia sinica]|uniref:flavonoid 3'-monooxygenase CYP75B137-like n=1 Tax=Magnolia sinica TaxID=86752 RepID=UPI00265AA9A6|nr:flavonoid 3'-monooxygenase CYP75B137-like [Magnolia sinica]